MNYSNCLFIIDTAWGDRWQIYRRLQELKIPRKCSTGQRLVVTVDTPTVAIQVWSVTRTQSIDRHQLIDWLDRCFTLQADYNDSESLNR
jgi:hypothetical protein